MRKWVATDANAIEDHGKSQIMEVQETKEGKFRNRKRREDPIGDKQRIICRFDLQLEMNCSQRAMKDMFLRP